MTDQTQPRAARLVTQARRSSLAHWLALTVSLLVGGYGCESELACDCEGQRSCACDSEPASCDYYGQLYSSGESFRADCNTCSCSDGVVLCTTKHC